MLSDSSGDLLPLSLPRLLSSHFPLAIKESRSQPSRPKQQLGNDKLILLETKQNLYISLGGGEGRLVLSQQVTC